MVGNLAQLLHRKVAASAAAPASDKKQPLKKRKVSFAAFPEQVALESEAAQEDDEEPVQEQDAAAAYDELLGQLSKRRKAIANRRRDRPESTVVNLDLTASKDTQQEPRAGANGVGSLHAACKAAENGNAENGSGFGEAGASDGDTDKATLSQGGEAQPDATNTAPDVANASDSEPYDWELHFRMELSSNQLALLKKQQLKFRELPDEVAWRGWGLAGRWLGAGCSGLPPVLHCLTACGVKERVCKCWARMQQQAGGTRAHGVPNLGSDDSAAPSPQFASDQQKLMFNLCNSYRDVFFPAHPYPNSLDAPDPIMDACLLHATNHVARCADLIRKNNAKLAKDDSEAAVVRDQGFTRPKVLILLPMRNYAYRVGKRLLQLLLNPEAMGNAQGLAKFEEHFGAVDSDDEEGSDGANSTGNWGVRHPKPAEHRALFSGNCDDHFRLGIRITRGAVRLGAPILDSDVVLASPIALATALAEEGRVLDWLSSIEVLLVVRADVLAMQNWAHVESVLQALNVLPREQHNEDIMRVREGYLSGNALHYRQTILLASHTTPDMMHAFNSHTANHQGCIRWKPTYTGVLSGIVPLVQQRFHRLDIPRVADSADVRWNAFTTELWPNMRHTSGGLLLFVPHYFDFVRLRNFLIEEDTSFAAISDYSKPGDITRSRSRFFHRQRRVLVLTERAQFYHRLHIRGIQDCIFYGLPQHAEFYQEILNMVDMSKARSGAAHATMSCLFSKWDALALERVVGTKRAEKMLKGETSLYMFC